MLSYTSCPERTGIGFCDPRLLGRQHEKGESHVQDQRRNTSSSSPLSEWRDSGALQEFQTGVSLHSHTLHSREVLDFIPRLSSQIPILGRVVQWELDRYRRVHGSELDWENAWWTPPLSPRQAWEVETGQIRNRGLLPLTSITDHDSIDAPLALNATEFGAETPISFEWTVPYRTTFFHLGIHNLPKATAQAWFERMEAFTAKPSEPEVAAILADLCREPQVLVVLNHPLWDEKGIGAAGHRKHLVELLQTCKQYFHALEFNGLRGRQENAQVAELCREVELPLISGGDRHTFEPNACINLTNAATFREFVEEIRQERVSRVFLMKHYRHSLFTRILKNVSEVLRANPDHCLGWTRWSDRVFYIPAGGAEPVSVATAWGDQQPWVVSAFVASMGLLG